MNGNPLVSNSPVPAAGIVALRDKLRNFIRGHVRDAATADDLTQETLLKVFRARQHLREGTRLESWLFQIARNVIADHFRQRRREEPLPPDLVATRTSPDNQLLVEIAAIVRSLIDELPPLYRTPLLLSEVDGLPHAEVASRLGLTLTATKSRVRRGRLLLKKKLQDCCRLEFNRAGQLTECEPRRPDCCD